MKTNIHTNIVIVSILLSVIACGRQESLSLEEAGGEIFTYSSPITSIVPAGDSLIVGSVDGRIAYFDTRNGLFSEQPYSMGGAIYDMVRTPTYLYCSVRDGGVRRVDLYNPNSIPEVFEIEHKRSQYSPYDILLTDDDKTLYGATSNGFFKWDITSPSICGEAIKTLGENDPFRFYGILQEEGNSIIYAGQPGLFRYDGERSTKVDTQSTRSLHDGYRLLDNGCLSNNYFNLGDPITRFKYGPRNFIVEDEYVFAISDKAIERYKIKNNTSSIINLPEKHLSRPRNQSCRAICQVIGPYLYVAPGGNRLYRLPVKHNGSEEIISVCSKGDDGIYVLSENHDLYSVSVKIINDTASFSKPHYIRTINEGRQVRLLASEGDDVYAVIDTTIRRLVGKSMYGDLTLTTPHPDDEKSVTCNLYDAGTLYQGRTLMVRSYDYSQDNMSLIDSIGINLQHDTPDYYPKALSKIDNELIIGTLHGGVYSVRIDSLKAGSINYKCVDLGNNTPAPIKIIDIKSIDNVAFILTDKNLYRYNYEKNGEVDDLFWPIDSLGNDARRFNCLLPIAPDRIYLYSNYHDFSSGASEYTLINEQKWKLTNTLSPASSINDAVFLNGINLPIFVGSSGICTKSNERSVNRPCLYTLQKIHAETYFWGLILAIVTLLIIIGLIVYSYLDYGKRRIKNEIMSLGEKNVKLAEELEKLPRKTVPQLNAVIDGANGAIEALHLHDVYMRMTRISEQAAEEIHQIEEQNERDRYHQLSKDLRSWSIEHFHSGYVIKLAEELISISGNSVILEDSISKFKQDEPKLKTLDELGCIINEVKSIVSGTPMQEGAPVFDEQKRKNELDAAYMAKVVEFFNYYADEDKDTSEWGKVFDKAVDKKRPSTYKLSFMILPLCVKDAEGEWLPTLLGNFPTRKSEWKKGNRPPYYLRNFMDTTEYGLFGLVARAGLTNLENKGKD